MSISVKTTAVNCAPSAMADIKALGRMRVLVGVPEEKGPRERTKEPINNAQLTYIHTFGSPARGIPARPIIEAAIEYAPNKAVLAEDLSVAAKAALAGDKNATVIALKRTALEGQNIVRDWFTNPANSWAPNTPSTIRRKGSDRPLINTGQLRNANVGVVDTEGKP